eukprot:Rmarinus@m.14814
MELSAGIALRRPLRCGVALSYVKTCSWPTTATDAARCWCHGFISVYRRHSSYCWSIVGAFVDAVFKPFCPLAPGDPAPRPRPFHHAKQRRQRQTCFCSLGVPCPGATSRHRASCPCVR